MLRLAASKGVSKIQLADCRIVQALPRSMNFRDKRLPVEMDRVEVGKKRRWTSRLSEFLGNLFDLDGQIHAGNSRSAIRLHYSIGTYTRFLPPGDFGRDFGSMNSPPKRA